MARRQRSVMTTVAMVVVPTVVVLGLVLPRLMSHPSAAEQPATAVPVQPVPPATLDDAVDAVAVASGGDGDVAVGVAAPTAASWGVPVGYPQSPAGVRAAAVAWVAALPDLMQMGPIARQDTLGELLSQRAVAETLEEFRAERDRFAAEFQRGDVSQAVWMDAPLTVQIVEAADTRAVVEVWSALHFGTTTSRVDVLWRTHTVTLVWERDSWRVDDVARRDGPTPVLATTAMPSSGDEFGDVVEWTPAVLAGTSVG